MRRLNCVCDYCDVTLAKDDGLKEEEMKENEHLRMFTCERWQVERWRMVANKSGNGKFENNNMRRLMHIGADMTGLNEWMNAVVSEDLKIPVSEDLKIPVSEDHKIPWQLRCALALI